MSLEHLPRPLWWLALLLLGRRWPVTAGWSEPPGVTLALDFESLAGTQAALPPGSQVFAEAEDFVPGRTGQAFHAQGDKRLELPAVGLLDPQEGTMEFWYRPADNWLSQGAARFFDTDEPGPAMWLDLRGSLRNLAAYVPLGGGKGGLVARVEWQPGEWHHVMLTWSAARQEIALYADGQAVARNTLDQLEPYTPGAVFGISRPRPGYGGALGDLDDFTIYNYAREPLEATRGLLVELQTEAGGYLEKLAAGRELPRVRPFMPRLERYVAQVAVALAALPAHTVAGAVDVEMQQTRRRLEETGRPLLLQADRLVSYLAAVQAGRVPAEARFLLGVQSPMTKVFLDQPFAGQTEAPLELSAARGEHEAMQVVLLPLGQSLREVRVSSSDLVSASGARLAASNLTISPVGYVYYAVPTLWPDVLLPNQPFNVTAPEAQPVWVSVFVPPGAPPGDYTGTLTVRPRNAPTRAVPLRLHVWDFDLPQFTQLRSSFWLFPEWLPAPPDTDKLTLEFLRPWIDATLDSRLCPMLMVDALYTIYREPDGALTPDFTRFDEIMGYILDQRHANSFRGENQGMSGLGMMWLVDRATGKPADVNFPRANAGYRSDPQYWEFARQWVSAYYDHIRAKGWMKQDYFFLIDEPGRVTEEMAEACRFLHQVEPQIRIMCTVPVDAPEQDTIDIWVPLTPAYNQETADRARSSGDEVWWYVCVELAPYADVLLTSPAIDGRLLPWMNFRYGSTGLLYWGVNYWADGVFSREPGSTRCHFARQNGATGDGYLLYVDPAEPRRPLRTTRLDNLRDGVEDYDYLCLLRDRLAALRQHGDSRQAALCREAEAALQIPPTVITSMTEYTKNPELLYQHRARVAELLERVDRALEGH